MGIFLEKFITLSSSCTPKGILIMLDLSKHVKQERKKLNLTQVQLAMYAGVGLRFIRELEQGKQTLQLDKVQHVLGFLGSHLVIQPIANRQDPSGTSDE